MIEVKRVNKLTQKDFYYQTVSPPKVFLRIIIKRLIRFLIWLLVDFEINGRENFPKKGPAILIANHVDLIESALILGYPPRQVEIFSAIDFPYDPPILQKLIDSYGVIPIFRGRPDKRPLKTAVNVLKKKGFIAIFPEGSTWEPGLIEPKSGFAWMSAQTEAEVIPIAFSFLKGSLGKMLKFKRPHVVMSIGKAIPPLCFQDRQNKRQEMETYTKYCWQQILALLEPEEYAAYTDVSDEHFEIDFQAFDCDDQSVPIPEHLQFSHIHSFGLFIFRTAVYDLFNDNYKKEVQALEQLHTRPSAESLKHAASDMLEILEDEVYGNPYAISFHLGDREGEEINESLHELISLCDWAIEQQLTLHINPKRMYYSNRQQKEIIQTVQVERY